MRQCFYIHLGEIICSLVGNFIFWLTLKRWSCVYVIFIPAISGLEWIRKICIFLEVPVSLYQHNTGSIQQRHWTMISWHELWMCCKELYCQLGDLTPSLVLEYSLNQWWMPTLSIWPLMSHCVRISCSRINIFYSVCYVTPLFVQKVPW